MPPSIVLPKASLDMASRDAIAREAEAITPQKRTLPPAPYLPLHRADQEQGLSVPPTNQPDARDIALASKSVTRSSRTVRPICIDFWAAKAIARAVRAWAGAPIFTGKPF